MKVVHLNKGVSPGGDIEQEIKTLKQTIRDHPGNEKAYTRLMIIFRKQKAYKEELKVIDTAIRVFEEKFSKTQPVYSRKVRSLSSALLKATGLADKKGNNLYQPGELSRWKRRRHTVLQKLKG